MEIEIGPRLALTIMCLPVAFYATRYIFRRLSTTWFNAGNRLGKFTNVIDA